MALTLTTVSSAATLQPVGVLGNSGEQGEGLVRYGFAAAAEPLTGVGVVADRAGSLWTRGGQGVLNRYAVDGRLLAQYKIPTGARNWDDNDQIALVGDLIVLKQVDRIYTLPVTAAPGTAATALTAKATRISFGSHDGWLAMANRREIALLQPATGETKPVTTVAGDVMWLDMGPDGAVYPVVDWKLHRLVDGKEAAGWPKEAPGERPQLLDGEWFAHTWHGTIKRFDANLEPAPGVVLGGASGSFIGHLDQNSELSNGRGLVRLRGGLYAVSGMGGTIHLLSWAPDRKQFDIVRRIGALPYCHGLGLDRKGNVWWFAGSWHWDDAPDTPLRLQVNPPDGGGVGQIAMLDDDRMVAAGWLWGKPAFYHGLLTGEVSADRIETGCTLPKQPIGTVACQLGGQPALLIVDAAGAARGYRFDHGYRGELGPVELKLAEPGKAWTSLALKDGNTLLAGVDGRVIELTRDGAGFRETRRWHTWADDSFGPAITLALDAGRLWVSDTAKGRVLCFELASGKVLAQCDGFEAPTVVAARGERGVVYDSGRQRVVKVVLGM